MKTFTMNPPYCAAVECCLAVDYPKRQIRIYAKGESGWEPWMTATSFVPGLNGNEIAIKNYSENEGVLDALIRIGAISQPHRQQNAGLVKLDICSMNRERLSEYAM